MWNARHTALNGKSASLGCHKLDVSDDLFSRAVPKSARAWHDITKVNSPHHHSSDVIVIDK